MPGNEVRCGRSSSEYPVSFSDAVTGTQDFVSERRSCRAPEIEPWRAGCQSIARNGAMYSASKLFGLPCFIVIQCFFRELIQLP